MTYTIDLPVDDGISVKQSKNTVIPSLSITEFRSSDGITVTQINEPIHTVVRYGVRILNSVLRMSVRKNKYLYIFLSESIQSVRILTPDTIPKKLKKFTKEDQSEGLLPKEKRGELRPVQVILSPQGLKGPLRRRFGSVPV